MKTKYKYLICKRVTTTWRCYNKRGAYLGHFEWCSQWKQYEYVPDEGTGYSFECLDDISDFLQQLNAEKKGKP